MLILCFFELLNQLIIFLDLAQNKCNLTLHNLTQRVKSDLLIIGKTMSLKMVNSSPEIKNILAVAAGKGGVGKSTVAVNLALALHKLGYRVGLMDTDVYGPSVRKMLPEDTPPKQKGNMIIPAVCRGIKMISTAYFRNENEAAVIRAPIANGIITQFIKNVEWGQLDYLLIDFPPGTGDIQLTLSQQANLTGALMVTTPQEVALMDVRKAIDMFNQVRIPIVGIIENMSYFEHQGEIIPIFGKGGGAKLAQIVNAPFLGEIPIDPMISRSGDLGESIFEKNGLKTIEVFLNLAKAISRYELTTAAIKKIKQFDEYSITVEWSDGFERTFRVKDLQLNCPCAGCVDEVTGKRLVTEDSIDKDVTANKIMNVGRYALKVEFSSGCSTGIYSFDYIRNLK